MTPTRREIHFLIACCILFITFAFFPQETISAYEIPIIAFIGFPLGIYLATDPERRKRNE